MRATFIVDNLGPYHVARLSELSRVCELNVVEIFSSSSEYLWLSAKEVPFESETVAKSHDQDYRVVLSKLLLLLNKNRPDVVFVPGWSSAFSLQALLWCRYADIPAIVLSDSQEIDFPRFWATEWLKKVIIRNFSGALVAGSPHERYLNHLGMTSFYIRRGYDVVDNEYFQNGADIARANAAVLRQHLQLPERYFLTCARFVSKKNLKFLVEAYRDYRIVMEESFSEEYIWDLVIVGDGGERESLVEFIDEIGCSGSVKLLGFCQYDVLPSIYGLASTFVLPSLTEQWGLVVNEAMAAGLPVLVSRRCGCAEDLVDEGSNGWKFDPEEAQSLASLLVHQTLLGDAELDRMGRRSRDRIGGFSLKQFATSAVEVSRASLGRVKGRIGVIERALLATVAMVRTRK